MKPEEIDKMDQEFIQEMLRSDLNRVMVTKGEKVAISGKGPQEKGTTKLADTGTQSGDKAERPKNEQDRGNKR